MIDLDFKVLKTLYRKGRSMKVGELKSILELPHSTVGSSVKRLKEEGLVEYEVYRLVQLTEKGLFRAKELIRHMQLLEILLYNELGLTVKQAHAESEKFNLLFSCETINKICEKYDHPRLCPCGNEIESIPSCSCEHTIEN